jgi:hypothetical protein
VCEERQRYPQSVRERNPERDPQRERSTERERKRDPQRERERERSTQRETDRRRERERGRERERERERSTECVCVCVCVQRESVVYDADPDACHHHECLQLYRCVALQGALRFLLYRQALDRFDNDVFEVVVVLDPCLVGSVVEVRPTSPHARSGLHCPGGAVPCLRFLLLL